MGVKYSNFTLQLLFVVAFLFPYAMAAGGKKKKAKSDAHSEAHGEEGEYEDAGHNLFMLNWHLDPRVVGSFLIAILCSTMVLEWAIHYMESKAEEAVRRLIDRVYKELALLGLISFCLFMINTFGTTDEEMYLAFEYAHLLIFFLALAYILQAGLLIGAILPMSRRLEKLNTLASSENHGSRNYSSYWGFRIFRAKFIEIHDLPKSFLFDLYHLQSYKSYVTSSLEIAPYCWMSIIVIFIIHVLLSSYYKKASDLLLTGTAFMIYGWLILAADFTMYWVVSSMHKNILKNLIVEQKAKAAKAERAAKGTGTPSQSLNGDPRKAPGLTKTSSSLKEKRHSIEKAHTSVTALKKKHHHLSVVNLDETTLVAYGGFTRRQDALFKCLQDLLLVFHCLYLSSFFITYIGRDLESNSLTVACILILVTPIPIFIAMLLIGPGLITRYLLVMSLSRVNVEALDDVVEYMEHVEEAFECIAEAMLEEGESTADMQRIFSMFDTEGHGVLSYSQLKAGLQEHWGLRFSEKEFRALTRFLDSDSSGYIDLEDFMKLQHGEEIFDVMTEELNMNASNLEDDEEGKVEVNVHGNNASGAYNGNGPYNNGNSGYGNGGYGAPGGYNNGGYNNNSYNVGGRVH